MTPPTREKLPRRRTGKTYSFTIAGDLEGYAIVGEYDDGRPGELFLTVAKQGSTLNGILDVFGAAISFGLQYGVPLEEYCTNFIGTKFENHGFSDDIELPNVESVIDYVFRRIAIDYLPGVTF